MADAGVESAFPISADTDSSSIVVPAAAKDSGKVPRQAWTVLGVTLLIYTFSQVDRKLPLILVESIRKDLHLSDTQIGLATGIAFTLVYSLASIPISRIADRYGRKLVICASLVSWSAITALNGLAMNFTQFTAARMGVAIGEAGCTPAAYALIADTFPPKRHAIAISILMLAGPLGYLIGVAGGGYLNDLANWRITMMIVAMPSLLLTIVAAFALKEPLRSQATRKDTPPFLPSLRRLFAIPTYRQLILAAAITSLGSGSSGTFAPAYVMRHFGMSSAQTGLSYGLLAAAAGITSGLVGGFVADRLQKFDPRIGLWYVAGVNFLAAPSLIFALWSHSYPLFLALMFLPEASIIAYAGPAGSAMMALVDKRVRALASSIFMFAFMGIGFSLGPVLTGMVSDALKPAFHNESLKWAMLALSVTRIWGAAHYVRAARNYGRALAPPSGQ